MDKSPLQELPAELRNQIYELALYEREGVGVCVTPQSAHIGWERKGELEARLPVRLGNPLALTMTCKAIREESLGLFYSINRFTLFLNLLDELSPADLEEGLSARWRGGVRHWLASIGDTSSSCLKSGEFHIGCVQAIGPTSATVAYDQFERSIDNLFFIFDHPETEIELAMEFDFLPVYKNYARVARFNISASLRDPMAFQQAFDLAVDVRYETAMEKLLSQNLSIRTLNRKRRKLDDFVRDLMDFARPIIMMPWHLHVTPGYEPIP